MPARRVWCSFKAVNPRMWSAHQTIAPRRWMVVTVGRRPPAMLERGQRQCSRWPRQVGRDGSGFSLVCLCSRNLQGSEPADDGTPPMKRSSTGSPQSTGTLRKARSQVFLQVGPAKDKPALNDTAGGSPGLDPDSPSQQRPGATLRNRAKDSRGGSPPADPDSRGGQRMSLRNKTIDSFTGTLSRKLARAFSFQLKEGIAFA